MTRVTVVKVKRFPTDADKAATCYVGRAAWGWPASPWANPYKPKPLGAGGACVNIEDANQKRYLQDCLNLFVAYAAGQSDAWWDDLWAACDRGAKPLGCFCETGDADDLQHVCHAGVLGAELNRRYTDAARGTIDAGADLRDLEAKGKA